jgi:hypothetical protein
MEVLEKFQCLFKLCKTQVSSGSLSSRPFKEMYVTAMPPSFDSTLLVDQHYLLL